MSFISTLKKPMNKIDRYLLENHPLLWEVKLHWVAYFVLLTHVVVTLFVLAFNITPDKTREVYTVYGVSYIIIVLAFCYWIAIFLRFNLANENGKQSKWKVLQTFFSIMLVCALFSSLSYTVPTTMLWLKKQQTDVSKIRNDIDALNEGNPYFIENTINCGELNIDCENEWSDTCIVDSFYLHRYYPYAFDSVQENELGIKTLSDLKKSYENKNASSIKAKIEKYIVVNKKLSNDYFMSVDSIYMIHQKKCELFKVVENGSVIYIGPSIRRNNYYVYNDWDLKDQADLYTFDLNIYEGKTLWVYFIFFICISNVLLVFKFFRWQSFILVPIFFLPFSIISTVLIVLIVNYNEDHIGMNYILLCFILALFWGIKGAYKQYYSWFAAICLMAVQLTIPFLFDYLLMYCKEMELLVPGIEITTYNNSGYDYYYTIVEGAHETAILMGFVLYLVLLPFFRNLSVKYNAIPKKK